MTREAAVEAFVAEVGDFLNHVPQHDQVLLEALADLFHDLDPSLRVHGKLGDYAPQAFEKAAAFMRTKPKRKRAA